MKKIRKGDQVIVLSGRDKGRRGRGAPGARRRPRARREREHGEEAHKRRTRRPASRAASSRRKCRCTPRRLRIWNPGAKKGDRIGVKTLTDGKRVRFFKSNGEMLDA